jgi:hypothetical protein
MTGQLIINALVALVVFQSLVIAFLTGVLALLTIFPQRLAALRGWWPGALRGEGQAMEKSSQSTTT